MDNMEQALRTLKSQGAAGVDGVTMKRFKELYPYLKEDIAQRVASGKYRPQAIRRTYIPKHNNQKELRMLGIPTALDRLVQASIVRVLEPLYVERFSLNSFGFIKGRNCFLALNRTLDIANGGKRYVIKLDLKRFFDNVPHEIILGILNKTLLDKRLINLIHKFLIADAYEKGKGYIKVTKGVPQGGPLSPLLSNIVLNELDQYLEKKNISFVRYADDCIILFNNKSGAEFFFKNISNFIEKKLNLVINYEKSSIKLITDIEFLGYSFKMGKNDKIVFDISDEKLNELKMKIGSIIGLNHIKTDKRLIVKKINEITRGWLAYYAMGEILPKLQSFDKWFEKLIHKKHKKICKEIKELNKEYERSGNNRKYSDPFDDLVMWIAVGQDSASDKGADYYMNKLYKCGYKTTVQSYKEVRDKWKKGGMIL
ncbi:MAG: group II intron reverse transcriptase/maturase [Lachnospiraceae bacterium]|nr:group II intron reverse transcriptase/maturase [Lachnospiraceae bacterium]